MFVVSPDERAYRLFTEPRALEPKGEAVGEPRDGYAPISDYAAIGDGRTVALVARDGSIDWLPLPDLDSPTMFAALLDARQGGRFTLAPEEPYGVKRRYLPHTNVLETTFTTGHGTVRVTDAMTLTEAGLSPLRELARRIEGLAGTVRMRWSVEPRFGYAGRRTRIARRNGVVVADSGSDAVAVCSFGAGEPDVGPTGTSATLDVAPGSRALLVLAAVHQEPLVIPARDAVESRLDLTIGFWRRWVDDWASRTGLGEAVVRSALVLKLLAFAPSGAIAAAATTSLPEQIGGVRNWDYRFSWVRDSAFAIGAFLALGCSEEADSFFWWLMQASQLTRPRLRTLYRLDGGTQARERSLDLEGYQGSAPVRVGNDAARQLQLDIYGDLFYAAWLYADAGNHLDHDISRRLVATANLVCRIWWMPDSGIWEVRSEPQHFTHSKMMCWVALDRAIALAKDGHISSRNASRWRREAEAIQAFIETRCWSEEKRSYVRSAGDEDLDAALLLGAVLGYGGGDPGRLRGTLDAVRRELGRGPFVQRYTGEDGLPGTEGAFLACSFWLVDALARSGLRDEAEDLMGKLLGLANDVGLYAEEIDSETRVLLGNFPQALTHLALVNAARTLSQARAR